MISMLNIDVHANLQRANKVNRETSLTSFAVLFKLTQIGKQHCEIYIR